MVYRNQMNESVLQNLLMVVPPDALDLTTAKTLLEMMGIAGVNFGLKLVMGVAGGGGSALPTHKPSILMPRASALVPTYSYGLN